MAEKEEIKQLTPEEIEAAEKLQKELSEMSGTKRAAVLMLLLGEQQAAEIIRFLNPKEVQALGGAMVSVADLSQEAVNSVLDEFVTTLKKQTSLGLGTTDYVEKCSSVRWATTKPPRCWAVSCRARAARDWKF